MIKTKLAKVAYYSLAVNEDNLREKNLYFVDEKEQAQFGLAIMENGIDTMPPLRVVITSNGEKKIIGGTRRYSGLSTLTPAVLSELQIPCLLYEGITPEQEIALSITDNESRSVGYWAKSIAVERLLKFGKTQEQIALVLNIATGLVSELIILTKLPTWVRNAGMDGKISALDTLKTYAAIGSDSKKLAGKKMSRVEKIEAISALLERDRAKIENSEVYQFELLELGKAVKKAFGENIKLAADKLAADKLAADKLAADKLAADKLAADKLAADKLAADKLAADNELAKVHAAQELGKLELARLEAQRIANESAKLAAINPNDKVANDKAVADKLAADKLAADKLAADKLAADKLAADKLAADKLAANKLAADKLAADKLAADKLAADKLAADKALALEHTQRLERSELDLFMGKLAIKAGAWIAMLDNENVDRLKIKNSINAFMQVEKVWQAK